eukprot:2497720-Rhodomonas_salina.2
MQKLLPGLSSVSEGPGITSTLVPDIPPFPKSRPRHTEPRHPTLVPPQCVRSPTHHSTCPQLHTRTHRMRAGATQVVSLLPSRDRPPPPLFTRASRWFRHRVRASFAASRDLAGGARAPELRRRTRGAGPRCTRPPSQRVWPRLRRRQASPTARACSQPTL